MFHMRLRRMNVLQLLGLGFYKHELGPVGSDSCLSLLLFCLLVLSITDEGLLTSPVVMEYFFYLAFSFCHFAFMHFEVLLLDAYMFRTIMGS